MRLVLADESQLVGGDLSALAEEANREHALVMQSGEYMVAHAIKSGEALLAAKQQVGHGGWYDWLAANFTDRNVSTAQLYMRLARNKNLLLGRNTTGIKEAARLVRGAPDTRHDSTLRKEAKELKRKGHSSSEIGVMLGVAESTIYRWVNPDKDRKYARNQARLTMAGRRAEQQRERQKAVNIKGGAISEAYSLIRKAAQLLDQALTEAESKDSRTAISTSINRLHIAEDEIVRASRLG